MAASSTGTRRPWTWTIQRQPTSTSERVVFQQFLLLLLLQFRPLHLPHVVCGFLAAAAVTADVLLQVAICLQRLGDGPEDGVCYLLVVVQYLERLC